MRPRTASAWIILITGTLVNLWLWWGEIAQPYAMQPPDEYPFATLIAMAQADKPFVVESQLLAQLGYTSFSADTVTQLSEQLELGPPAIVYHCHSLALALVEPTSASLSPCLQGGTYVYMPLLHNQQPFYVTTLNYRDHQWSLAGGFEVGKSSFIERLVSLQHERMQQGLSARIDLIFWSEMKSPHGSSIFGLVNDHGQPRLIPLVVEGPYLSSLATSSQGYLAHEILPLMQAQARAILWERASNPTSLVVRVLLSIPYTAVLVSLIFITRALLVGPCGPRG